MTPIRQNFLIAVCFMAPWLMQGQNPQLWGLTSEGGIDNRGVIFSINGDGNNFTAHSQLNDTDGAFPQGDLLPLSSGVLYSTAKSGGANSYGVIFSYNPSDSSYTDLFDFDSTHGAYPAGTLVSGYNNLLYGVAIEGGQYDDGIIFSFNPSSNAVTDLYDFDSTYGVGPIGQLLNINGVFYGMTFEGGAYYGGVIFSFNPAISTFKKLYDFNTGTGEDPHGSLIQASDNKLYGMTTYGGDSLEGTVFSFDAGDSVFSILYSFTDSSGNTPLGSLTQVSANGYLYGLTSQGGAHGLGTIFSFNPSNSSYTDILDFNIDSGQMPEGSLLLASDGNLYGTTFFGGDSGVGVIFKVHPSDNSMTKIFDFSDSAGSLTGTLPVADLIEFTPVTSVPQLKASSLALNLYPNPAANFTELFMDLKGGPATIRLTDIAGKVIMTTELSSVGGAGINLRTPDLPDGIYFVTVNAANEFATAKLIISR